MAGPPLPRKTFDRSLIEGPLRPAVWRLAWPTMLQNLIAGLQGIIDHAMVGHFVGYTANAAIGVSWQIIIVVNRRETHRTGIRRQEEPLARLTARNIKGTALLVGDERHTSVSG